MQDAHKAYLRLEERIVRLELAPGAMTTEAALIEASGLGRTPTREAIQRLAWEGFLEVRPRAGLRVAWLDPADWERVIDAREGLECAMARSAASRPASDETQHGFEQASSAMLAASKAGDVRGFLEADKHWDEVMAEACGNPFAARVASPLQTHSRRFWFSFAKRTGLKAAADRHVAVIEAVIAHDPGAAVKATQDLMAMLRQAAKAVSTHENAPDDVERVKAVLA